MGRRAGVSRRKEDYPETGAEFAPEVHELLGEFTEEEIEAGAVLRGEREAARRTRIEDLAVLGSDAS